MSSTCEIEKCWSNKKKIATCFLALVLFIFSAVLQFYVISVFKNDSSREVALATIPTMNNGGSVWGRDSNCNKKTDEYVCYGLWSCSSVTCSITKTPNITFATFMPSVVSDSCDFGATDIDNRLIDELKGKYSTLKFDIDNLYILVYVYCVCLGVFWLLGTYMLFSDYGPCCLYIFLTVGSLTAIFLIAVKIVFLVVNKSNYDFIEKVGQINADDPPQFLLTASALSRELLQTTIVLELFVGLAELVSFTLHSSETKRSDYTTIQDKARST